LIQSLKDVDPNLLAVGGVLLILREVFGFLKLKTTREALINENQEVMDEMRKALEENTKVLTKIADHMDNQIELLREFSHEIKEVRSDIDEIRLGKTKA